MDILTAALHRVASWSHAGAHRRFLRALEDPEQAQRARLSACLRELAGTRYFRERGLDASLGWESFAERQPLTGYADWSDWIERQRAQPPGGEAVLCEPTGRYEPTSGSTARRKWIPYPPAFLRELDAAASPWLRDLGRQFPGTLRGRHYWSLSWLPEELRLSKRSTDDTRVLPPLKRALLASVMAVPEEVALLSRAKDARLATAALLAGCRELSLLSVWSPTFALELFSWMAEDRGRLAEWLETGRAPWPGIRLERSARAAALLRAWDGKPEPAFFRELWPRLALVSAWDSFTSAPWARELERLLPQARFQGKGLWSTEGVISIPFQGRWVLALGSHFLEFRCLETGRVLPSWRLEPGQKLQPVLTASNGLLRYALQDSVEVTGLLGRCPCVRFLGRLGGVDLVGEKIDASLAAELLARLGSGSGNDCLCLLAVAQKPRPAYRLLAGPGGAGLSERLEQELLRIHHYRVARELGQLELAEVLCVRDPLGLYSRLSGTGKLEPVLLVEGGKLSFELERSGDVISVIK
jgi:hypothetical protein